MNRFLQIVEPWASYLPAIMILLFFPSTSGPLLLAGITAIILALFQDHDQCPDVGPAILCLWVMFIALDNLGYLTLAKDLAALFFKGLFAGFIFFAEFVFDIFVANPMLYIFVPAIIFLLYLASQNNGEIEPEEHKNPLYFASQNHGDKPEEHKDSQD